MLILILLLLLVLVWLPPTRPEVRIGIAVVTLLLIVLFAAGIDPIHYPHR